MEPAKTDGAADETPRGNYNDKRAIGNRAEQLAMDRFDRCLARMAAECPGGKVLDLGCGDGARAETLARQRGPTTEVIGIDLPDNGLEASWREIESDQPNVRFQTADAAALPFPTGSFQLVMAIESLEHVADPTRVLEEVRRVCTGFLIVSVPREPLWRFLNIARRRHVRGVPWREWGDTPGHVSHWSRRGIRALLRQHGTIVELRSRLPWTIALVRLF